MSPKLSLLLKSTRDFKSEVMASHGETQWMPVSSPSTGEEKENKPAWELEPKGLALEGESVSSGHIIGFLG